MKAAIYTIAKNEEHNVAAFMAAAEGADVYVLDTGSTDKTVDLLKQHGAYVEQKTITPWRFDVARNEALAMVPSSVDACVSLDMDEVIESGWQQKLKEQWQGTLGDYQYIPEWKNKEKTEPLVVCNRTRIHARHGFEWHRKIHEIVRPINGTTPKLFLTDILVKHYQNDKQRHYCYALDELIEEYPDDMDARLQRAGEMYQKQEWKKALDDYLFFIYRQIADQHPQVRYKKSVSWVASAYCYFNLGNTEMAYRSFLFAAAEYPESREAWTNLAHLLSQTNNIPLAYGAAMTAQKITSIESFMAKDVACWGDYPKQIANDCFGKLLGGK